MIVLLQQKSQTGWADWPGLFYALSVAKLAIFHFESNFFKFFMSQKGGILHYIMRTRILKDYFRCYYD
jgi:hypothetical protein